MSCSARLITTAPSAAAIVASHQKIADLFFELKIIPRHVDVAAATWGLR